MAPIPSQRSYCAPRHVIISDRKFIHVGGMGVGWGALWPKVESEIPGVVSSRNLVAFADCQLNELRFVSENLWPSHSLLT